MTEAAPDRTLAVAERLARILEEAGVRSALIGAAALAVHGYPRATADLDLAVATDPFTTLRRVRDRVAAEMACDARLVAPDADDPLGGVLTVSGPGFDPVQVVNFLNPLSAAQNPGAAAVDTALDGLVAGTRLRVVDLPHLVALKLYAGGPKSRLDVLELLDRNPTAPHDAIAAVCERVHLGDDWRRLLAERAR